LPITSPAAPGADRVILSAVREHRQSSIEFPSHESPPYHLIVEDKASQDREGCCTPLLAEAQQVLVEAHRLQKLPDDYTDVTQGRFASWKAWIKRKLLGNFKPAYVDALSRQHSPFNHPLLTPL